MTQAREKTLKIESTLTPTSADIDFLTNEINEETPAYGAASPFGFFVRDETGTIIAGCNGAIIYGEIYTDQLWVHKDFRGQGYARNLMEKVHALGLEKGCAMATTQTMSFQGARAFYEHLGYHVDFERAGYTQGSTCLFLRKDL